MKNWNKYITVEIKLFFFYQGQKIYFNQDLNITGEDIWFTGNDRDSLRWAANFRVNDFNLLISGRAILTRKGEYKTTVNKLQAFDTFDGIRPSNENYKIRPLFYS